jgi:ligand-binding sensor domain-containing protein
MMKALWQKIPRWFRAGGVILSLLSCAPIAQAQEQTWATVDTYDGLPSNSISALFFDRDGNLWIGTDRGIALFSIKYHHNNISRRWIKTFTTKDGLAGDEVLAIAQDREGHLWFGTTRGASRYDGHSFRNFTTRDGLAGDDVRAIAQDREGHLWLGTTRGVSRYDGHSFRNFTTRDGLVGDNVRAITQDREGHLWLGTTVGASRYDGHSFRNFTTRDGLAGGDVQAIAQDREGYLWFGTIREGASRYDGHSFRNFTTKDGLAGDDVHAIAQDREGHLWLGTIRGGASRYDGHSFRNFTTKDGLAGDDVWAIAQDREGHLWLGASGGASRFDGLSFRSFTTRDGLAGDFVRAIAQDREGHFWLGTSGGASRYDGRTFRTFTKKDGLAADGVQAIAQDREGHLWLGTICGASRYDGRTFRTFTKKDGLAGDDVRAIAQDREGHLWFGTYGGASRYDGRTFRTFTKKDGLAADDVQAIAQDREGYLWLGTIGGASRYDGHSFRNFTTRDGLAGDAVQAIAQDREGHLWLGTFRGGASRYDGHSFRNFTTRDGLAGDDVLAIAQDREGRLWLGTTRGVSRYDGHSFRNFTTRDGLADGVVRAIAQDREGKQWFGTSKGLSVYEETEVLVTPSRLVLALTIRPRLISYGPPPSEVLWSYRLDDQSAWSDPSRSGLLVRDYLRLGSGKHVLRIRAWDGKAIPPRTTVFPFEVSGLEQSIAIAAYLLLLGAPLGAGLYRIGKKQAVQWAVRRRLNPYRAGLPVGPDLFTGREGLLKEVTAELANHCVLLTGERRIGKTSFLHALGRRLAELDEATWRWIPCYATLEGIPEDQFFTALAGPLVETVRNELPPDVKLRYSSDPTPASRPYGLESFVDDLTTIALALDSTGKKPVKLVFLIDEVDALNSYTTGIKLAVRRLFMSPNGVERYRTVMTGFRLSESIPEQDGSPPFNYLHVRPSMPPFQDAESRSLIVEPVRGFYRYEPAAVGRIIVLSAGRPLAIQAFCFRLIERILDQKRRTVTRHDVDAVQERVLDEVRKVMESGSSHAAVRATLTEALERIIELERERAATTSPATRLVPVAPSSSTDAGVERKEG